MILCCHGPQFRLGPTEPRIYLPEPSDRIVLFAFGRLLSYLIYWIFPQSVLSSKIAPPLGGSPATKAPGTAKLIKRPDRRESWISPRCWRNYALN
jgi:hypothetical protein